LNYTRMAAILRVYMPRWQTQRLLIAY